MTTAVRTPPHHDTLTCYTDYGCRLSACIARARSYEGRRRAARAAGTWQPLVDAEPVRLHLLNLYAAGLTPYRVATIAGLQDNIVRGFTHPTRAGTRVNGRRQRATPEVAARILAIDPDTAAPAKVSSIGARRRLQALIAIGWTAQAISRLTGISGQTLYNTGRADLILRTTATAIADAYEQLKTRHPRRNAVSLQQYNTARNRAASHRWPPPSYWDQTGAVDDQEFIPEYGITRSQIIAEETRWLLDGGLTKDQAAHRLGISRFYVDKALRDYPQDDSVAA